MAVRRERNGLEINFQREIESYRKPQILFLAYCGPMVKVLPDVDTNMGHVFREASMSTFLKFRSETCA